MQFIRFFTTINFINPFKFKNQPKMSIKITESIARAIQYDNVACQTFFRRGEGFGFKIIREKDGKNYLEFEPPQRYTSQVNTWNAGEKLIELVKKLDLTGTSFPLEITL